MKLTFLGTGSTEGFPSMFCGCEICRKALDLKGPNIRTRTSLAVDGKILLGFGPDTYAQATKGGVPLADLEAVFISHYHYDHFDPSDLRFRRKPYTASKPRTVLALHGNERVLESARRILGDPHQSNIALRALEAKSPVEVGEHRVTPYATVHDPKQPSFAFVVESGGQTMLVAYDMQDFETETWVELARLKFDVVVLDCLRGSLKPKKGCGHMTIAEMLAIAARLETLGALKEPHRIVAVHFSHIGGLLHAEVEAELASARTDVIAAYDGLEIDIDKLAGDEEVVDEDIEIIDNE
jgi:phosphoribosyl 1,2-cyclic phosphate phosphodiesterase